MPYKFQFDLCPDLSAAWSNKWSYRQQQTGVKDVISMWVADMDFDTAPAIKEAVVQRAEHGVYGYTAVDQQFQTALIDWMRERCSWQFDAQWLSHTPGVICAIHTAVRAFSSPGSKILVQPPVYHPFYRVMKQTGREVLENPLIDKGDYYELDLEHFERQIQAEKPALFLLCNPHNPVGKVYTRQELRAMGDICKKHGVIVIADEIHGDLTIPGIPHTPFASLGEDYAQNCIACSAPSKTFNLAGLQLSNIIIPNSELRRKFTTAFDEAGIPHRPNLFALTAATAAYEKGSEWLDEARQYLLENRKHAIHFLQEHIPALQPYQAQGTYFLWLDCRKLNLSNSALESFFLKQAGLWCNQGHTFGTGGEGFVRINLACSRTLLEQALTQLQTAVETIL